MESIIEQVSAAGIRGSDLGNLLVPRPTAREQELTAEILTALDDKIAIDDRIAATCEALAIACVSVEEACETVKLGNLVDYRRRQVSPAELVDERVSLYSLPAYDAGRMPEIVSPRTIKSGKYIVEESSVLISKLNPSIQRIWSVVPDENMTAIASTEFLVLKPIGDSTPAEVWAVCNQPDFIEQLAGEATGTSNSHQRVRPDDVLSATVIDVRSLPPTARSEINVLVDRAYAARHESTALAQLRDTLLPKLMSGELRIKDAERLVEDAV